MRVSLGFVRSSVVQDTPLLLACIGRLKATMYALQQEHLYGGVVCSASLGSCGSIPSSRCNWCLISWLLPTLKFSKYRLRFFSRIAHLCSSCLHVSLLTQQAKLPLVEAKLPITAGRTPRTEESTTYLPSSHVV